MCVKRLLAILTFSLFALFAVADSYAKPPKSNVKIKFYDFSDQLIDGEIKKPTALYTDVRSRVKFERLLRLKKSFLRPLFDTAREKVFK